MAQQVDQMKAQQAVLYICHKLAGEDSFGSTVLNKVLYYIDHVNYLQTGKTITGFSYVKQVNGPTPTPSEFFAVKSALIKSGDLAETDATYFGKLQKRCIAITSRAENVDCFTSRDVAVMDLIVDQFKGVSAKTASDLSHQELSWKMARPMEPLPPFVFLLSESELNNDDMAWATGIIQEHQQSSESQPSI